MGTRWRLVMPCVLAALHAGFSAAAEPRAPAADHRDDLIVTGQLDHVSPGKGGGAGAMDWLRSYTDGAALTTGVASYSIGGSRWNLAKLGGAVRMLDRVTLHGQINVGPGRVNGSEFIYLTMNGGVTYQAMDRIWMKAENQFIDIDKTRGNLPKLGLVFVLMPDALADVAYAQSTSGNLNTELVSGRIDFKRRPVGFMGGFAAGRSKPETFNVVGGTQTRETQIAEVFAGLTVAVPGAAWTLVFDYLDLQHARRRTLTLSLRLPVDKP